MPLTLLAVLSHLNQPVEKTSEIFLGTPYVLDPLGEGETSSIDRDPLYRFDQFDCTTYVETVMALSLSKTESDFKRRMNEIRYSGNEQSYFSRNHFIETEWLPNAISKHFVKEITGDLFQHELLETAHVTIDRNQLFQKKKIKSPTFGKKEANLTFIPISKLIAEKSLFDQIPTGTFFNLIKIKPTKNGAVVHQGILIRKEGKLIVRHATTLSHHQVIDMDAIGFFRMHLRNQRNEHVQKLGIQLFSLGI